MKFKDTARQEKNLAQQLIDAQDDECVLEKDLFGWMRKEKLQEATPIYDAASETNGAGRGSQFGMGRAPRRQVIFAAEQAKPLANEAAINASNAVPIKYPAIPTDAERVTGVSGIHFDPEGTAGNKFKQAAPLSGTFSIQNGRPIITPFVTKALENVVPGLASGATEFGLYGIGNVISEAALSDPNQDNYGLSAQSILGTVGTSAVLGA